LVTSAIRQRWASLSPNFVPSDDRHTVDTVRMEWRAYCNPFNFASILSYMVSCLASLHYKISSEVFERTTMMKSMSSIVSTVCNCGLVFLDFFHNVGFMGETFLFLEVSASSIGSLGGVTLPYFCLSSSPFFFLCLLRHHLPLQVSLKQSLLMCCSTFVPLPFLPSTTAGCIILFASDQRTFD
jgi:hypothetical protein